MKGCKRLLCAVLAIVFLLCFSIEQCTTVWGDQIKNADVFSGADWNYMTDWTVAGEKDWLQSMCETDQYIVCFQDAGKKGEPDVITVFDKYSYNVLFEVKEMDFEHGNGMTYNYTTNEVYIAPYNPQEAENKGMIFALDADTLKFKRRIRISDGSWNAASIEYAEDRDQYIVQTTRQRQYAFIVLDSEFNEVDELFKGDQSMGNLFQDFCVSGDFIISVPWMRKSAHDPRIQIYSISQRSYLGSYSVYAPGAGEIYEPQSICQSSAGEIVLAIAISGTKRMALYNTYVPIIYTVETTVENGEITPTRGDVDMGRDYTVEFSSTEDYELKQLQVDGEDVSTKKHKKKYTFGNIQDDHSIFARFTEIPKFEISTSVTNGKIDESQLIRRDLDATIAYEPELHYEVDEILVDGKAVDGDKFKDSYTFEFIQEAHSIDVKYKEIPSFPVSTEVYNGHITASNNKVYRDENYTVKYNPYTDYSLAYIRVDGDWLKEIDEETQARSYTFENMQKEHDVLVVYQWKYLPYAILAAAFLACIPMGMIYLVVARIRKRRSRRTNRNRNEA